MALDNLSSPTLNTNINANDKNINTLSYIRYNPSGISTSGVEGQMWYDGSNFKASTSTGSSFTIGSGGGVTNPMSVTLDANNNDIDDVGGLSMQGNISMNQGNIFDCNYIQVDQIKRASGSITISNNLILSTGVVIDFQSTAYNPGNAGTRYKPSSTCEGYITIKVGNADKKVAYYS